MHFEGQILPPEVRQEGIFYSMIPDNYVPAMIILAISATVVVSQSLITGVFTMVNEAIRLKLWFNMKVSYPTQMRGQVYIPAINWATRIAVSQALHRLLGLNDFQFVPLITKQYTRSAS